MLLDNWRARGWKDYSNAALAIVESIESAGGTFDAARLSRILPEEFLARNGIKEGDVIAAVGPLLSGIVILPSLPPLIPIDLIDTFAQAADIAPDLVAAISSPLPLPEHTVKAFISRIVGEPYIATDWGGERDDIFDARAASWPTSSGEFCSQGTRPTRYARPWQTRQERRPDPANG